MKAWRHLLSVEPDDRWRDVVVYKLTLAVGRYGIRAVAEHLDTTPEEVCRWVGGGRPSKSEQEEIDHKLQSIQGRR